MSGREADRGQVLVVDDDRGMTRTLADVLSLNDWQVTAAHSGEEAIEQVRNTSFALVLMDIKMPGISGVEALKEMRRVRPGLRVVLMTAYSAHQLVEEAVRAGVVAVLSKPLAIPELLRLVTEATRPSPILVVDDNPAFLKTLCAALEDHGVRTCSAGTLDEALERLEGDDIQVVALDLRLDGLDATDSVLAIKEARPQVLLILFTGYPRVMEEVEAHVPRSWVVGSLFKPFDPERLLRILEAVDAG